MSALGLLPGGPDIHFTDPWSLDAFLTSRLPDSAPPSSLTHRPAYSQFSLKLSIPNLALSFQPTGLMGVLSHSHTEPSPAEVDSPILVHFFLTN